MGETIHKTLDSCDMGFEFYPHKIQGYRIKIQRVSVRTGETFRAGRSPPKPKSRISGNASPRDASRSPWLLL